MLYKIGSVSINIFIIKNEQHHCYPELDFLALKIAKPGSLTSRFDE